MLKISLLVLLAVVVFVSVRAFGNNGTQDPATAFAKIAKGAKVIDVRTAEEFAAGHLPDATNIPYEQIVPALQQLGDSERPAAGIVLSQWSSCGHRQGRVRKSRLQ
ncbi:rhodanese-like domain-containing protein [Shewanella sp.]|uniref:rhodanese-like domain-containing protein n=1 Tax=Shewanella sp. TaxID=50422 RepID=UPI003D0EAC21